VAVVGWQAFNVVTVLWAAAVGWRIARLGRWRQGLLLVVGAVSVLVAVFLDFLRDALGRSWPFVGGFGVMVLALVLSVQLALDLRHNEILLSRLVADSMRVRDQLNTPLQTLRTGLEVTDVQGRIDDARLARLRRAVERLTKLGQHLRS
jgi:hypothetical protein